MNKKLLLILICAAVVLGILLIPVPQPALRDGGTREYTALTYKIVDWNRLTGDSIYDKTCVYFLGDRFKSIEELWVAEMEKAGHKFLATVVEISGTLVTVEPLKEEDEGRSSDRITFSISALEDIGAEAGSVVEVTYTGLIRETYPASIDAISWRLPGDLRYMEYTGTWVDRESGKESSDDTFNHITITRIYANCFFADPVLPMPYKLKLNGTLSDDWCVGDQISVTYENAYYDQESGRLEADLLTLTPSDFTPEPGMAYKPVIYLYPEERREVTVRLALDGRLTCTYPAYDGGWRVTAAPDGTLTDEGGQTYNYLYWEGQTYARYDLSKGFCVKGADTAAFLEQALAKLGLTRREANEFIVYWLPLMQENPYNIISFQTDAYTDAAKLEVAPAPDTVIRVFMAWQASETEAVLEEQILSAPERKGFTVVEWGGTQLQ